MAFFKRKLELKNRYPTDRLSFLPGLLCATIMSEAEQRGFDKMTAIKSKFGCGYLLGFPDFLDQQDEAFGGKVRQLIFDAAFGAEEGRELFKRSMGHWLIHDEQTRFGWGAGAADGVRYFRALEQGRDATGSSDALRLISRSKTADFGPQVL